MKVYQVGCVTEGWMSREGNPELEYQDFIFDIIEVEDPIFTDNYEDNEGDVKVSYQLFNNEKDAVKEFLEMIDNVQSHYEADIPKVYDKIFDIAKKKYPEILI